MSYQCRLGFYFFSDSPGEPPLWASFGVLVENRCSGFMSVFHSCFLPSKNETGSIALGLESPPRGFLNLRKWSKNDRDPTTIEVEVYLKRKNTIKYVVYPVIKGVSQSLKKGMWYPYPIDQSVVESLSLFQLLSVSVLSMPRYLYWLALVLLLGLPLLPVSVGWLPTSPLPSIGTLASLHLSLI